MRSRLPRLSGLWPGPRWSLCVQARPPRTSPAVRRAARHCPLPAAVRGRAGGPARARPAQRVRRVRQSGDSRSGSPASSGCSATAISAAALVIMPSSTTGTRLAAAASIAPTSAACSNPPTAARTSSGRPAAAPADGVRRPPAILRASTSSSAPAPRPVTCVASAPVTAAIRQADEVVFVMPISPSRTRSAPSRSAACVAAAPAAIGRRDLVGGHRVLDGEVARAGPDCGSEPGWERRRLGAQARRRARVIVTPAGTAQARPRHGHALARRGDDRSRDLLRPGVDALGVHAVIGGGEQQPRCRRHGRRAATGDRGELCTEGLERARGCRAAWPADRDGRSGRPRRRARRPAATAATSSSSDGPGRRRGRHGSSRARPATTSSTRPPAPSRCSDSPCRSA